MLSFIPCFFSVYFSTLIGCSFFVDDIPSAATEAWNKQQKEIARSSGVLHYEDNHGPGTILNKIVRFNKDEFLVQELFPDLDEKPDQTWVYGSDARFLFEGAYGDGDYILTGAENSDAISEEFFSDWAGGRQVIYRKMYFSAFSVKEWLEGCNQIVVEVLSDHPSLVKISFRDPKQFGGLKDKFLSRDDYGYFIFDSEAQWRIVEGELVRQGQFMGSDFFQRQFETIEYQENSILIRTSYFDRRGNTGGVVEGTIRELKDEPNPTPKQFTMGYYGFPEMSQPNRDNNYYRWLLILVVVLSVIALMRYLLIQKRH